jgi:SAM-dependent methyltransferase
MTEYDASTYGERIADVYDAWPTVPGDTEAAVARLAELAGRGPVLELGIGTGRLALPLAARGLAVQGIDASPAMVAKLREKPGGERIPVALGDFADVAVDGRFALIFVAFNTFFALLSQEAQVRCFAAVAARLAEGGVFVIQAFAPDLARYDRGQRLGVIAVDSAGALLEASVHDPVAQRVHSLQVSLSDRGVRTYPVEIRYAWPSELDLMARLAGLTLQHRWGGWDRQPFTTDSRIHVSVYARAA